MKIAFLQKQSLIEYPGKISAVIFTSGCNFRCPWCYLPSLVLPERIKKIKSIPKKDIFDFLKERRKFLEAVVFSGGEPTINPELPEFIEKIKKMGYLIGLETNGTNPEMLQFLIEKKLLSYAAMDIKNDLIFEKYNLVVGGVLTKKLFKKIKKSIEILLEGKIDYELRTTLMKEFHKKEDIIEICKKIKEAKIYYLQNFEKASGRTLSKKNFTPFTKEEILEIAKEGEKYTNIKARAYLLK